jgi:hypothetical protein
LELREPQYTAQREHAKEISPDNFAMRRIADKLGFRTVPAPISSSLTALLDL